jgi:NAD(P)-dependent dehydrogenase (short-subunit alcohol dehydrogenase family)
MNTLPSKKTQNRTAIITGGGRGIGKETTIMLSNHVENIIVCSRTKNEIDIVVDDIEEINDQVSVLRQRCDVSISSQVYSLITAVVNRFGSVCIDILVNNDGVAFDKKLVDTSEGEIAYLSENCNQFSRGVKTTGKECVDYGQKSFYPSLT